MAGVVRRDGLRLRKKAREDVRVGTLSGDERCHRCGGENVNWCAPSPLWNLVMRGNDINGDPRYDDLVCIRCFVVLAEEAGVRRGQWRLFVDPEPYGLVETTPTGRVWDAESWMWREPADALDAVPDVPPTEDCGNDCMTSEGHREGCPVHCGCYDVPPDPLAADLDQVAAILAEYVYEAWRVGRYGQQSYEPMWHESSQPTMLEADRAAQALRAAGLLSSGRLVDAADVRARALDKAANDLAYLVNTPPLDASWYMVWLRDRAMSERDRTTT